MPIALTLLVFESWYQSLSASRTGKWTLPLPGERPRSCSHAVLVVGYEEDASAPGGGYFLARNSWSESWGKEGYALIPYTYVQRYACDAFTGPKVPTGLEKEARDCEGRKHPAGTPILVNPDYPEDFMEDTQANRKKFEEYHFVWNKNVRYDLVKKAVDKKMHLGYGDPNRDSDSIYAKNIATETGFTYEEVERLFNLMERREEKKYKIRKTPVGIAIHRPEK